MSNTDELNQEKSKQNKDNMSVLRNLIEVAFSYRKNSSGITDSFDFKKYIPGKYFKNTLYGENEKVDGAKLKKFLHDYKSDHSAKDEYKKAETFIEFIDHTYDFNSESDKKKFVQEINANWESRQLRIIELFDNIDSIFNNLTIGIIEASDISTSDSQKIFNLINTGGTQLTASEIMSAKPSWNAPVQVSSKISTAIDKLYGNLVLDVSSDAKKVKWDIPASLVYYLEDNASKGFGLFFKLKPDDIAKRITIGFKLISGFYQSGVKKEDIDNLANLPDTDKEGRFGWNKANECCEEIKNFFNVLADDKYLQILNSWGKCLSDIVSDGPTMNYLFLAFRSWIKLGKPTGHQNTSKHIFNKNLFILFDSVIYEYQTNQWRGSSDSRIAKNIIIFENDSATEDNGLLKIQQTNPWTALLEEIFESNQINGKPIEKNSLSPMVFYYDILTDKTGKADDPADIDHIIPQAIWESSTISNKDVLKNSLLNLALLPQSVNRSKNKRPLSSFSISNEPSLVNDLSKYEDIAISDFAKYSQPTNWQDMRAARKKLYKEAFETKRTSILENNI